jgi:hypothetical protein
MNTKDHSVSEFIISPPSPRVEVTMLVAVRYSKKLVRVQIFLRLLLLLHHHRLLLLLHPQRRLRLLPYRWTIQLPLL